jgi:hypothetical protein
MVSMNRMFDDVLFGEVGRRAHFLLIVVLLWPLGCVRAASISSSIVSAHLAIAVTQCFRS